MMYGGVRPAEAPALPGIKHTGTNVGFYSLPRAVTRAVRETTFSGIRHRVETCKATADEHAHPMLWSELHYVVVPVTAPGGAS